MGWKSVNAELICSAKDAIFYELEEITEEELRNGSKVVKQEPLDLNSFIPVDDFQEPKVIERPKKSTEKRLKRETNQVDLPGWKDWNLHQNLQSCLLKLGFTKPTAIQSNTLSHSILHFKDIIGAAETGSGKTLAFGLPILNTLASEEFERVGVTALILVPTRELAIQVTDHLKKAGEFIDCHIVPIVGGMSTEKQDRLIKKVPDVVVATPGRLYQFLSQDSEFAKNLLHIRYFVLDEADRMLENGHFKNLDDIIETISVQKIQEKVKRQTFVFSATMLEDNSMKQKASNSKKSEKSILFDNLLKKIEFRDDQPVYVNLTREQVTAKGVLESKINCLKTDKDLMLYYVLTRYTGKTIVFVNSIDAIRRLVPILSHLKSGVFGLHAELQQKQRLKNLERFKQIPDAVLIASDVAARGLDIPNVDHVVHYQLPRTADIYVHRAGRTARGIDKEGISVMLLSPEEMTTYKKICFTLSKPDGLPDFPVDSTISSKIKQRLTLARQIDQLEHKQKKNKTETDWFKKAAEEADILVSSGESDQEERLESDKKQKNQIMKLKQQLQTLMQKQVIPKGQSASYITMKTNAAQNAINSKGNLLPTVAKTPATNDLKQQLEKRKHLDNPKSKKKQRKQ